MRILLLAFALLVLPSVCLAEPSPTVRYLMKEPVTLFDWGIIRLFEYVEGFTKDYLKTNAVQDIYSTVTYDALRNNILISFVVTQKPDPKGQGAGSEATSPKNICRTIIREMRREFLADRDQLLRRSSGIYRFFGHVGFRGEKEPLDAFEEIENITVIQVSVYSARDPGKLVLHVESPLMSKEVNFGQQK